MACRTVRVLANLATTERTQAKRMVTEEQFIRLFLRHEAELRSFARTLMVDAAATDDLVQEACIQMWRKIDTLQSADQYRAWAYTYVRFTALNRRRAMVRSPLVFSDAMVQTMADEGAAEAEHAAEELRALRHCLEELDPRPRELIAHYYARPGVTAHQVAEQLGRTVDGVYKSLQRVRGLLRRCIERKLNPATP